MYGAIRNRLAEQSKPVVYRRYLYNEVSSRYVCTSILASETVAARHSRTRASNEWRLADMLTYTTPTHKLVPQFPHVYMYVCTVDWAHVAPEKGHQDWRFGGDGKDGEGAIQWTTGQTGLIVVRKLNWNNCRRRRRKARNEVDSHGRDTTKRSTMLHNRKSSESAEIQGQNVFYVPLRCVCILGTFNGLPVTYVAFCESAFSNSFYRWSLETGCKISQKYTVFFWKSSHKRTDQLQNGIHTDAASHWSCSVRSGFRCPALLWRRHMQKGTLASHARTYGRTQKLRVSTTVHPDTCGELKTRLVGTYKCCAEHSAHSVHKYVIPHWQCNSSVQNVHRKDTYTLYTIFLPTPRTHIHTFTHT